MRTVRIYRALIGAAMRSELQYRTNLIMQTIGGVAFQGIGFAFIWVVVNRFGAISGWSIGDIAFLYGMRLTAHGLWTVPFSQLVYVEAVIRNAEFDRYLVRPVNPFIQLVCRRVMFQTLGDLAGGVALLGSAATLVNVDWSPLAVCYLVLALAGGALVEVSVNMTVTTLAFRFTRIYALRLLVDDIFNTFGSYPMRILPSAARFGLTFVLPLAFVAYFPASVLLHRTGQLSVPAGLAWCAPVVGIALFVGAYKFWMLQTKHYSSSGH